ncbi:MAG: STAS domain-containing protein [Candidatus Zixiibacteriota bacterium]|nr:MAG: STAS domain-containing protein [candidate division Zixibacteria bacterium]
MFDIRIAENGHVLLSGRLDASQINKAQEGFNHITESCTVDFSNLEYISSAGLGVLLAVRKRLGDKGHKMRLIGMNKHIHEVFRYSGMNQIFEIE